MVYFKCCSIFSQYWIQPFSVRSSYACIITIVKILQYDQLISGYLRYLNSVLYFDRTKFSIKFPVLMFSWL